MGRLFYSYKKPGISSNSGRTKTDRFRQPARDNQCFQWVVAAMSQLRDDFQGKKPLT
jgi:hypothetical protein